MLIIFFLLYLKHRLCPLMIHVFFYDHYWLNVIFNKFIFDTSLTLLWTIRPSLYRYSFCMYLFHVYHLKCYVTMFLYLLCKVLYVFIISLASALRASTSLASFADFSANLSAFRLLFCSIISLAAIQNVYRALLANFDW